MLKYCVILVISIFAIAGKACAQVSGSITLASDYSYRGVSLSNERPVAQLNLVYDAPDGWYAGAFGSKVKLTSSDSNGEQILLYSGFSRRLRSGLIWEAGATAALFPKANDLNYGEVFAGLMFDNLSARIYYSPNYIGLNSKTLYMEANADYQLQEHLDLFSHIGWLVYPDGKVGRVNRNRVDLRVGVGSNFSSWKLQLAYSITRPQYSYKTGKYQNNSRNSLVFSASYLF
ncbi:TorF family putative porin [Undibacterium umbellatum]|uniref:Uncharacterized protein n=1 Tax=Undibacterium umbellatum TaxID=2762300 RepID=A0ABR6ZDI5_9BURK|nr:TorF family putative porin [Undibacterium umbellatum]MBC3909815.1 hypothetical protein [Undibacterium umbellatum]